MFPSNRNNRSNNRGNQYFNNRRNDDRRSFNNRRDDDRRGSSSGWGGNRVSRNDVEERNLRIAAEVEVEKWKKKYEETKRQKDLDEEAQNQRFGAFGADDDSSSDGGAPVVRSKKSKKNKKNKRRLSFSSSSSSTSSDDIKRSKYSEDEDDDADKYTFLEHTNFATPQIYHQRKPEKQRTKAPEFNFWRKVKPAPKIYLNDKELKQETVEFLFPHKEPTEVSPGVFQIDAAPYDIKNDASRATTSKEADIDWTNVSFEEFLVMDAIQQGVFAQASATKKHYAYKKWIKEASTKMDKVKWWIMLINLEKDRTEEIRKAGKLTGKCDVNEVKKTMIEQAIKECGDAVDLRLLQIDLFTEMYGENSGDVKEAWKNIMNKFPNDLKMWRRRLTYFRNKRSLFNAKSYIADSLLPCLSKLGGILNQTFKSHPKQEGTEEFLVDVIVSTASLYIEMGTMYKAIGILQALVEFYLLSPDATKNLTFEKKKNAFKCYWETNIPKAGHNEARGWYLVVKNVACTSYDFIENVLIDAAKETQDRNALVEGILLQNSAYCKQFIPPAEKWAHVEKVRTESLWMPLYNSESQPTVFAFYNSFDDIKPYLLQIDKTIIEKAVFNILIKLGAVIPDLKDYGQEAIFHRCQAIVHDANFKLKYKDMDIFIDHILHLMAGADILLRCTIARIMTRKAFILDIATTLPEAAKMLAQFIKDVREHVKNSFRPLYPSEDKIIDSYAAQLNAELFFHFSKTNTAPLASASENDLLRCVNVNVLETKTSEIDLLSNLRYYVMLCRSLPHHSEAYIATEQSMTKLKLLIKVTYFNQADVDVDSEGIRMAAMDEWRYAKFHINVYNLGSHWSGNINHLALELYATLCYEAQMDPSIKFNDFDKCFTEKCLKENESLAEVYFRTWDHHIIQYNEDKIKLMDKLQRFIGIYPRNDYFTSLYVKNLSSNAMETRYYFIDNQSEDDVVKVLRSVIEVSSAFETILLSTKANSSYFYEVLRKAAELCLTSLIPESFLWRCLIFMVFNTKPSEFRNTFLLANDQCPWSKILLTYSASLRGDPKFVKDAEDFAMKAGIELFSTLDDIEELSK